MRRVRATPPIILIESSTRPIAHAATIQGNTGSMLLTIDCCVMDTIRFERRPTSVRTDGLLAGAVTGIAGAEGDWIDSEASEASETRVTVCIRIAVTSGSATISMRPIMPNV